MANTSLLTAFLWIFVFSWLLVGIAWQERFKILIGRLVDIATKPIILRVDKKPQSVSWYPRSLLESLVREIRNRFAKQYIALVISLSFPLFLDITWRILYIIIDVAQYFIITPVVAITFPFRKISESFSSTENSGTISARISALKSIVFEVLGVQRRQIPVSLKLSVAYPKLLSKRYPSPFKVIIYPLQEIDKLETIIKKEIENANIIEYSGDTNLISGNFVVIELLSQDIEFTKAVTKRLADGINDISFTGKPKDTAFVGEHRIKLSVTDKETSHEYVSLIFKVEIVDFVFDHISRPFLSKLISFILGLASVITYTLTLIGKIDETFGLASGTTAAIIATFVYGRFYFLFQQSKENAGVTKN